MPDCVWCLEQFFLPDVCRMAYGAAYQLSIKNDYATTAVLKWNEVRLRNRKSS